VERKQAERVTAEVEAWEALGWFFQILGLKIVHRSEGNAVTLDPVEAEVVYLADRLRREHLQGSAEPW
jgi:hypothetical protein